MRLAEVASIEHDPASALDAGLRCLNCGHLAEGKFCPDCGQSTRRGVPTIWDLVSDALNAAFSYDAKLWQTLSILVRQPGKLTVDWVEGRRRRYIGPFQLFLGLEAVAFLAHRVFFSSNSTEIDLKTKALTIVGVVFTLGLAVINVRLKRKMVEHLVAGAHIWAMLMFVLSLAYIVIPVGSGALQRVGWVSAKFDLGTIITPLVQGVMVVYFPLALRRIYGLSLGVACIETVALFSLYRLVAFVIETYLFT